VTGNPTALAIVDRFVAAMRAHPRFITAGDPPAP
jgi:hypothetical protein